MSKSHPPKPQKPKRTHDSGDTNWTRRAFITAATAAIGGGLWHELRDDGEPILPIRPRISPNPYGNGRTLLVPTEYLETAAHEYKNLLKELSKKKAEAHKFKKPLYIVIGAQHTSNESLYYTLLMLEAAKSLGIKNFFAETNMENHQALKKLIAEKSLYSGRLANEIYAIDAADQLGMNITPIDTFNTEALKEAIEREAMEETMRHIKGKYNADNVLLERKGGDTEVKMIKNGRVMPISTPMLDDIAFIQASTRWKMIQSRVPLREEAMLENIKPRRESGIVECGMGHVQTVIESLGKDTVVFALNTAPAHEKTESQKLREWIEQQPAFKHVQWAQDPNHMIQKVGVRKLARPHDAFELCNRVSEKIKLHAPRSQGR